MSDTVYDILPKLRWERPNKTLNVKFQSYSFSWRNQLANLHLHIFLNGGIAGCGGEEHLVYEIRQA